MSGSRWVLCSVRDTESDEWGNGLLMGAGQHTPHMFARAGCQHTGLLSVCLAVCTSPNPPTVCSLATHTSVCPPPSQINRLGVEFVKRPDDGKMKGLAFVKDPDGYW